MHFFTLDLMQQAGGNFVRWGHVSGSPTQIKAGDRLGILALQPGLDGEGDTRAAAWRVRADAFRDLIIYYRNHPSIVIWEGGNQKVSREHAAELRGYMDKYDPHGGRAYAHRRSDKVVGEFMDVCIGTEGGWELKEMGVVEGEYNREESPRRVWDDFSPPNFGYPEAKDMTYQLTSEQFAVNQVMHWMKKCVPPEHGGGANWIFSDSTSGGRVPAEVCRASGEVDGVRLPKEAYYVCRDDVERRAAGARHRPLDVPGDRDTKKTVYVAANGDEVELFVNGKSLGKAKPKDRYLFEFPDVTFEPGEIKAVSYVGGKPARRAGEAHGGPAGGAAHDADHGAGRAARERVGRRADRRRSRRRQGRALPDLRAARRFRHRTAPASGAAGTTAASSTRSTTPTSTSKPASTASPSARRASRARSSVTAKAEGLPPATIEIPSQPDDIENGATKARPAMPEVKLPAERPTHGAGRVPARSAREGAAAGGPVRRPGSTTPARRPARRSSRTRSDGQAGVLGRRREVRVAAGRAARAPTGSSSPPPTAATAPRTSSSFR